MSRLKRELTQIAPRERGEACAVLHSFCALRILLSPARPLYRCFSQPLQTLLVISGRRHAHDVRQDLRAELLHRSEQDHAVRCMPEPDWEIVATVDADNLAWLKEVVAEVGWPGQTMVGEDGAHAAWLLAQHADQDPAFQLRCLELLTQAVASGEAAPAALASTSALDAPPEPDAEPSSFSQPSDP